jgi:hypothetical protein
LIYNDLSPQQIIINEVHMYTIDTTTESINSTAGIALIGKIAEKIQLFTGKNQGNTINYDEIIRCMYGLICQGRFSFEELALFSNDPLFKDALHIKNIPSPVTIRLYLEKISENLPFWQDKLHLNNVSLLNKVTITPIELLGRKYIPVDIDVSPFDNSGSKKEGVSWTYKNYDGYAPIFSYIGKEGFMLDCELRPGSQHSQKNTPQYLTHNLNLIKQLNIKGKLLFRLDSGNDAPENLKILSESGHFFLIKRNLRKENKQQWLDTAKSLGTAKKIRNGKTIYTGVKGGVKHSKDESIKEMDIVFRVIERTIDENGNLLLFPDIEVETYWTNLFESPEDIIALYHDHGTSEQFHSELKSDMNVERFPSGKMNVNSLLLSIIMLAFNSLRMIGQLSLSDKSLLPYKSKSFRKRLRKVISDLIFVGCKIVKRSRKCFIRLWNKNPWYKAFKNVYELVSA